jgi:hypothetical protein
VNNAAYAMRPVPAQSRHVEFRLGYADIAEIPVVAVLRIRGLTGYGRRHEAARLPASLQYLLGKPDRWQFAA